MQNRNGNLADQETNLRRKANRLGAEVVGVVGHVGSGTDPYWVGRAVAIAEKHEAKLYAETTDRFVRHPAYHSKDNPNAQARESELRDLAWWADGVVLTTDLDPNASPWESRSYQRKRGQRFKGNRGGRPKMIDSQRGLLDAVLRLWRTLP